MRKLENIEAIIWDFDGVFYDYDYLPERLFYKLCDDANALAACSVIPDLDFEEALRLSSLSYERHHDTVSEFIPLLSKVDLTPEEFKRQIYFLYHKELFDVVISNHPNLIAPCQMTSDIFAYNQSRFTHAIATHSCSENWAKPILKIKNLHPYFSENHILGYEDYGFESKRTSARSIRMLLERLDLTPAQVAFVEDDPKNMIPAKEEFPDLVTVLKSKDSVRKPGYVDFVVTSPLDFLNYFERSIEATPSPLPPS